MVESKNYIDTAIEPLKSSGMITGAYAIVSGKPTLVDMGFDAMRIERFHSTIIAMTEAYASVGRPCKKIAVQFASSNILIGCNSEVIVALVFVSRDYTYQVNDVIDNILETLQPAPTGASFLQGFMAGPNAGPSARAGLPPGGVDPNARIGTAPGFGQMAAPVDHDSEDRELWNRFREGLEMLLAKVMSRGHAIKFIERDLKEFLRGDQEFPLPSHLEKFGNQVISKVPVKGKRNLLLLELKEFLKTLK